MQPFAQAELNYEAEIMNKQEKIKIYINYEELL